MITRWVRRTDGTTSPGGNGAGARSSARRSLARRTTGLVDTGGGPINDTASIYRRAATGATGIGTGAGVGAGIGTTVPTGAGLPVGGTGQPGLTEPGQGTGVLDGGAEPVAAAMPLASEPDVSRVEEQPEAVEVAPDEGPLPDAAAASSAGASGQTGTSGDSSKARSGWWQRTFGA